MEDRTDQDLLRYDRMVEEALRGVVREAIARVAQFGLPGGHALYITFRTDHAGVGIPDFLRLEYPQAMTIVLEHQFWDLAVEGEGFTVALSFKGRRHRLDVPFAAVAAFHDPGVDFGLRFDRLMPPDARAEDGKAPDGKRADGKTADRPPAPAAGLPAKVAPAGPRLAPAPADAAAAAKNAAEKAPADKSAVDKSEAEKPAAPALGQVVSLDQFRKK